MSLQTELCISYLARFWCLCLFIPLRLEQLAVKMNTCWKMDEQSSLKTQFSANDLTLKRIGKIIPLKNPREDKGNILKVIPGGHTPHPRAWKPLLWRKKWEKHWAFIYDSSQLAIRSYSFCINIIFMEPESLRLLFHRKCAACRVKNVHACMCVSYFSVCTDSVCVCERVSVWWGWHLHHHRRAPW